MRAYPFPRTLCPPATHDYTASLINATCNYDISADIESVDNPIIEGCKGGRDFKVEVTETIFPEQKIEKVACIMNYSHQFCTEHVWIIFNEKSMIGEKICFNKKRIIKNVNYLLCIYKITYKIYYK